jgi:hypothetical protein
VNGAESEQQPRKSGKKRAGSEKSLTARTELTQLLGRENGRRQTPAGQTKNQQDPENLAKEKKILQQQNASTKSTHGHRIEIPNLVGETEWDGAQNRETRIGTDSGNQDITQTSGTDQI